MADPTLILFSVVEGIATLTLNRPEKRNAMNHIIVQELTALFLRIQEDNACRVVILKANGEHFCAGADITWMQVIAKSSAEENLKDAKELATLLQLIYTFPKPVIVLAQGVTLGGGIGLIAAADIAIVAKSAKFAFPEVKLGISPSVISPYVIAAIGARAARYYFFTAEEFNGNLAVQIGLAHQVVEANVLATTGESLAKQLLQLSSTTLTATKHLTHAVATQNISEKLIEYTTQHLVERRASAEGREGLTAFLEKRPPEWLK